MAFGFVASIACSFWLLFAFKYPINAILITLLWSLVIALNWLMIWRNNLVMVGVTSLALRFLMLCLSGGIAAITPDQVYYNALALSLSTGHDLPYLADGYAFFAHGPHLYPYLLAIVYFVTGQASVGPWLLNTMLDIVSAALIVRIAGELGATRKWAILSAVTFFCWPSVVSGAPFVIKETLAIAIAAWGFLLLLRAYRMQVFPSVRYGAMLGLLGMAQPAFFLMFCGLSLVVAGRIRLRKLAVSLIISAVTATIVLTPWIIRNLLMTGGFIPLTSGMGMNMFSNAGGGFDFPDHLRHLNEAEWARRMIGEGAALIASNPANFLLNQAKGIVLGFGLQHGNVAIMEGAIQSVAPHDFAPSLQVPLVILWAWSLLATFFHANRIVFALLCLIAAYTIGVSIWFEFGERHRAYLLPLLIPYAASSGPAVFDWLRKNSNDVDRSQKT